MRGNSTHTVSNNPSCLTRFIFLIQFNRILKDRTMPDRNVEDKISQCVCLCVFFFKSELIKFVKYLTKQLLFFGNLKKNDLLNDMIKSNILQTS